MKLKILALFLFVGLAFSCSSQDEVKEQPQQSEQSQQAD
jgi:hypothetical protein